MWAARARQEHRVWHSERTLVKDGRIELRNFGVFKVKKRKPRQGRNPRTGGVDWPGVPVNVSLPLPSILQKSQSFAEPRAIVSALPVWCLTVELVATWDARGQPGDPLRKCATVG